MPTAAERQRRKKEEEEEQGFGLPPVGQVVPQSPDAYYLPGTRNNDPTWTGQFLAKPVFSN